MSEIALPTANSSSVERLRMFSLWSLRIAVAFFGVYPVMNWITSLRRTHLQLYLPAELAIPFVPQFVWFYLSMYVLFFLPLVVIPTASMAALGRQLIAGSIVSAVLFLLLPAELGFARSVPVAAPYASLYGTLFGIDRPYNLVPSMHVIYASLIALACADVVRRGVRILILLWLTLIVASTVFIHQHHLLDVAAAMAIVHVLRRRYEVTS